MSGFTISGTFTPDDPAAAEAFFAELRREAEAEWPAVLARLLEQSRLSGMEVVYDVSMAGFEWCPIFKHGNDQPVAWRHSRTGERHDGSVSPELPA